MLRLVWLVSARGGSEEREPGKYGNREGEKEGSEKEAITKRTRERGRREGQGGGMTVIGVQSPEDFMEEKEFELSLEDACQRVRFWGGAWRGPSERMIQPRTQG